MESERIGIWGPPSYTTTQHNAAPEHGAGYGMPPVPYAGEGNAPTQSSGRDVRIRWGLMDVIWGFLLLVIFSTVLSIGLVVFIAADMVANNVAVEDPEALFDSVMVNAYSGPFLFISSLSMYLAWWLVTRRATMKKGLRSYAKDFWLRFNWKRDIMIGLGLAAALRVAEQGVYWFLANVANVDMSEAGNTEAIIGQSGIWYVLNAILVAGLLAPFFEEFFFRGLFLQASMRFLGRTRRWSAARQGKSTWFYRNRVWLSVLVTSVAFGLMHFQGDPTSSGHWIVVAHTGVIGVILAVLTIKTKRLGPAIATHVLFNLSGVILASIAAM